MADKEDLRAAATIATSLSGFVIAGALALMGAEAAIFVFLLDKKVIGLSLWLLLLVCFLSLFVSCYLGGLGIWEIYADGAKGTWRTTAGSRFAFQLLLSLVGLLLLIACSIAAGSAPVKPEPKPEVNKPPTPASNAPQPTQPKDAPKQTPPESNQ